MTKQVNPTSKKREILHTDQHITEAKTQLADKVVLLLNEYKENYQLHIKADASMDEVVKAIKENNSTSVIQVKHTIDKEKLEENFKHLNEQQVQEILGIQSKGVVENLTQIATSVKHKFKGSGLTIDNFILNDEFTINSKVTGRIKNMASTYCTNSNQIQLRNLAIKIGNLVKGGLKSGLLSPNRLGIIAENIVDINTGEVKHQYIMRQ